MRSDIFNCICFNFAKTWNRRSLFNTLTCLLRSVDISLRVLFVIDKGYLIGRTEIDLPTCWQTRACGRVQWYWVNASCHQHPLLSTHTELMPRDGSKGAEVLARLARRGKGETPGRCWDRAPHLWHHGEYAMFFTPLRLVLSTHRPFWTRLITSLMDLSNGPIVRQRHPWWRFFAIATPGLFAADHCAVRYQDHRCLN